jgi:uncharacterized membrane protein YccC
MLRSSLQVDLSLLSPVAGAITALPVVAVFVLGITLLNTRAAVAMAIGANLIAIVSLVGAPRFPIRLALLDAAGMGFSVFVGAMTVGYPWLHVMILVPWCFGAGMLVALGQTQATVGTQAVIAYLVLGRFAGPPLASLRLSLLVVAGALIEVLALIVLRLPPSLRYQRNRLADAFEAVAELARRDPRRSALDVVTTLDSAERALSSPALFGRSDVRDLRAALDQLRRVRLELTTLAGLRARSSGGDRGQRTAVDLSLDVAASALDEIAAAVRHPRRATNWRLTAAAYEATASSLEETVELGTTADELGASHLASYLDAVGGQIRAAGNLVETERSSDSRHAWRPRRPAPRRRSGADRLGGDLTILRENLRTDSPAFRHAVRLAIAVPLSALVASWLSLPRSYWVPFAVAVILKPDYSTLFGRGVGRLLGTLLGATLAAALVSALHPDLSLTAVLVALTAWAAYSTWAASFSVAMGFVTALVLILLSTSLSDTPITALDRLIDFTLGGVIAMCAYLVWPTSPTAEVGRAQSDLFAALRDYLALVLAFVEGEPVPPARLQSASRATRLARANAEAAVGRSLEEPGSTRIDPSENRGLLAVTLRLVRAIHALRIEAERGATVGASPELDALCDGLRAALGAVADSLAGRPTDPVEDLRRLYRGAQGELIRALAPPTVAQHLDELVNSVNTAELLVGLTAA